MFVFRVVLARRVVAMPGPAIPRMKNCRFPQKSFHAYRNSRFCAGHHQEITRNKRKYTHSTHFIESAGTIRQATVCPCQKVWSNPRNALRPVECPPTAPLLPNQTTRIDFYNRAQKSGDSPMDYAAALQMMSRSARTHVAPDKREGELLWLYCRGSRPETVIHALMQSQPASLEEAVEYAEELMTIERHIRTVYPPIQPPPEAITPTNNRP